jgi:hypothetical protein
MMLILMMNYVLSLCYSYFHLFTYLEIPPQVWLELRRCDKWNVKSNKKVRMQSDDAYV